MRSFVTSVSALFLLFGCVSAKAQSFTVADTIIAHGTGFYYDTAVTGSSAVTYDWRVSACDFPADWRTSTAAGVCDNNSCRGFSLLWPSGATYTSNPYAAASTYVLELQLDFSLVTTTGTHYATMELKNTAITTDVKYETFYITFLPSLGAPVVTKASGFNIFPNPATNVLNVVSDASGNMVKVSDIYGREVASSALAAGGAAIDIASMPQGMYFVSLFSSNGEVVATQKFVKE